MSQPVELHRVFIVVESIGSKSRLAGAKDKLTYTLPERAKIIVETLKKSHFVSVEGVMEVVQQ